MVSWSFPLSSEQGSFLSVSFFLNLDPPISIPFRTGMYIGWIHEWNGSHTTITRRGNSKHVVDEKTMTTQRMTISCAWEKGCHGTNRNVDTRRTKRFVRVFENEKKTWMKCFAGKETREPYTTSGEDVASQEVRWIRDSIAKRNVRRFFFLFLFLCSDSLVSTKEIDEEKKVQACTREKRKGKPHLFMRFRFLPLMFIHPLSSIVWKRNGFFERTKPRDE